MSPYTYKGFRVVFVRDVLVTVSRTWKERWLTWPWKPWQSDRSEWKLHPVRPGQAVVEGNRLFMHEVDRVNFLARLEIESMQKERADKGEEAPLLVDPLSPPHYAGFERYTATIPRQESAVKFGTVTGRIPSKRDLLMQYQDFKFTKKSDDDEPSQS